jgi:restriction system protein
MEQPKWDEYLLPELKYLSDGEVHKRHEIIDHVVDEMKLTDELKKQTISAGETVYDNRGGWGLTYLKQSGLIESPKRATFVITDLGKELLKTNPSSLVEKDLAKYPKYQEFMERSRPKNEKTDDASVPAASTLTPDEMIAQAQAQFRSQACSDLLEKIRDMDPNEFEKLVIKVLIAMGYGDGTEQSGIRTGKTGDGGIDGVINQDKLGLDTIYIQAKHYKEGSNVDAHAVRDFVGALQGKESKGSRKGVFITTSDFTKEGREYAENIKDGKIILINGTDLANLMYDNDIGVTVDKVVKFKKIDTDFFDE